MDANNPTQLLPLSLVWLAFQDTALSINGLARQVARMHVPGSALYCNDDLSSIKDILIFWAIGNISVLEVGMAHRSKLQVRFSAKRSPGNRANLRNWLYICQ